MRVITYIACFLIFLLTGCLRTEGTIDIGGLVSDEITKKGIPNRQVIIKGKNLNEDKLIDVGGFCSDSLGRFSYTMNKTKGAYFYYFSFAGDSLYSYSTHEVALYELEKNGKFLSFYLNRLTDFTIKIERVSKVPRFDTLYVSWKSNGVDGKVLYPNKTSNTGVPPDFEFRWVGGTVKSVIETKVFANKSTVLCWELIRNGKKKEIIDTVYCEKDVANYINFKY